MPSSTSSSDTRPIPGGRWGVTWIAALVLAALALGGIERATRARGHRPTVVDDPDLWSLSRRSVDDGRDLVALMGASRMAIGFSREGFAAAAPSLRPLQLSIASYLPLTVLADLAADESFRGIAVIDLIEPEIADPLLVSDAHEYVERSKRLWRGPGSVANRTLASWVQERFALLSLGGRRVLSSLFDGKWPRPALVVMDRHRIQHGDYSLAAPGALQRLAIRRAEALPAAPTPEAWLAILATHLEPLVAKIRARGGEVVVIHMPISGRLASRVDELYPRARYWDAFAARSAATVIHFRDIPGMAELACPDDMHLDQRDQIAFTRALVEAMRARGLFARREAVER